MQKNDIIETFGDPVKSKWTLGKVKLITFIKEYPTLELWQVELQDGSGRVQETFIKKPKG